MLVLSRKTNEKLVIGSEVVVTVVSVRGNSVRLGIEAPRSVSVRRGELSDVGEETCSSVNSDLSVASREPALV